MFANFPKQNVWNSFFPKLKESHIFETLNKYVFLYLEWKAIIENELK